MADLSKRIAPYVGGKRFEHTASVAAEAKKLGVMFGLPDDVCDRLESAGWLHDLTKAEKGDGQLRLCERFGLEVADYERAATKTLHAKTGAELARREFSDAADELVYMCIKTHTTGSADMSLPQTLLCLADYIEPTRTFDDCVELRGFFYDGVKRLGLYPALNASMVKAFDMTIGELIAGGSTIHPDTVAARNWFLLHPIRQA